MTTKTEDKYRLAALAAGYKVYTINNEGLFIGDEHPTHWLPLSEDADAFRLMVDARISVKILANGLGYIFKQSVVVKENGYSILVELYGNSITLDKKSVNEAIFDCAVAIGQAMESEE